MLSSISVKNYRSFLEPTEVPLRAITVLLGRNSSGKSSLVRLIPLIQQSIERQSSSPILWTSDEVDFGTIDDVISHSREKDQLSIGLTLVNSLVVRHAGRRSRASYSMRAGATIKYQVNLSSDGGKTRFNSIELTVDEDKLVLRWSSGGSVTGVTINGRKLDLKSKYKVVSNGLFPELIRVESEDERQPIYFERLFYEGIVENLGYFIHKRTSTEKINSLAHRFPYVSSSSVREVVSDFPNVVKKRTTNKDALSRLAMSSFFNLLPEVLAYLEREVSSLFQSSAYIGPARVSGNRFDRVQELAVSRLLSTGENVAMYLHSLSPSDLAAFNKIFCGAFGQNVKTVSSGPGHVSILVGSDTGYYENITDVGFGFSQVLPVVAQMYAAERRITRGPSFLGRHGGVFAVEQPELHLHPAMQSSLADLFVSAISRNKRSNNEPMHFMIETHSESIVNRLGILVAAGQISHKDVAVYFVDRDEKGSSSVKPVEYNEDGIIENWPLGFFLP